MVQQTINLGIADKGNGDPLRTAFNKVNQNFTELYNQVAASVVVDATAPTDPGEGDLWWDPESGRMYVYYGTSWVDASPVDGAGISSTDRLVNGAYTVSLDSNGNLTVPDRITFDDGSWQSTAFIGHAYSLRNNVDGSLYVTLDDSGTINTPLLLPLTFTAVLDSAHKTGAALTLTDDPWEFTVQFQVNPDGSVETMMNSIFPNLVNPGYTTADQFAFTEADHGIPGYTFELELDNLVLAGPAGWTASPVVSIPPEYPATVKSLGAIKLTADTQSLVFGTDGKLTLPNGGQLTNGADDARLIANSNKLDTFIRVSTYDEEDENHFIQLVANGRIWRFDEDGSLTLPGTIKDSIGTGTLSLNAMGDTQSIVMLGSNSVDEMITSTIDITPDFGIALNSVRRVDITAGYDSATLKYNNWLNSEQMWIDVRDQDAQLIAPDTRPWAGMPSYQAYDILIGYINPPGVLPPGNNMPPVALTAKQAYLTWQEEQDGINVNITAKDKTWTFGNDGTTTLSGPRLDLGTTLGTIYTNQSTGQISIGDYIGPGGSPSAPSTVIHIGGTTNAFQISAYGSPAVGWTFDRNGRTIFPNGTVPEHSYGAAGDKEGMVVFTDPYIYYCKQDYVDNTTDIWVRVAWTGTNW